MVLQKVEVIRPSNLVEGGCGLVVIGRIKTNMVIETYSFIKGQEFDYVSEYHFLKIYFLYYIFINLFTTLVNRLP